MFKWHFLNFNSWPSPLVLSLDTTENLALSLHPPIRYLYTWIKSPSLGRLLPTVQRRPHLLLPSLSVCGKYSPLHQLHCSALWEWPSSSQLIHHPSQGRAPSVLPPLSCKVQNLLWILTALACYSCSYFLPCLARQILSLCSHLWLPKKIP